jgi:hypothetical protein
MADSTTTPDIKVEVEKFGRKRFSPGMYTLHWDNLESIPLKLNGEPSTLDALYKRLVNSKIKDEPETEDHRTRKYVTDDGDLEIEAKVWTLESVDTLAGLFKKDINPLNVNWFYYDYRSGDEIDHHFFFAVHDNKIESHCFNSEEPLVLIQAKEDDPINEAVIRYWYRKFYSETMVGNLMVLRPDEPILDYYDRATSKDVRVTLIKAYRLLWIAVVLLAAIAFPAIRVYMGFLAGALLGDLFGRIWASRKVGRG